MLTKYSPQILERQRTRFPEHISKLESIMRGMEGEERRALAMIIYNLRNELTILAMLVELQTLKATDNVSCEVI